jgi:hypothetical protein
LDSDAAEVERVRAALAADQEKPQAAESDG